MSFYWKDGERHLDLCDIQFEKPCSCELGELRARVAELEAENQELRQGLLRQPTFDNIERKPTSSLPPEKFQIVVQCPSCGIFVPQSQIKH